MKCWYFRTSILIGAKLITHLANRKILEKQTGVPERKVIPVIEPESPAFALKKRYTGARNALKIVASL